MAGGAVLLAAPSCHLMRTAEQRFHHYVRAKETLLTWPYIRHPNHTITLQAGSLIGNVHKKQDFVIF